MNKKTYAGLPQQRNAEYAAFEARMQERFGPNEATASEDELRQAFDRAVAAKQGTGDI